MAVIARPTTPAPRRTLRSYARNSRQVPFRATEATGDPIVNSDEDSKPNSPITSKMRKKDLNDVCIPETPIKSKPDERLYSEAIPKIAVPSAAPTPSPALTPSPERDLVEAPGQRKSDLSDASVLDVSHRMTRGKGKGGNLNNSLNQPSSLGSSKPRPEVDKRITRSRSKYRFRGAGNNSQSGSPPILVTDDDDDDDDVISTPIRSKSRRRLQRNAPASDDDDDVQEVKTPTSNKRRRTRSSSNRDDLLSEDPADNLELEAILSNAVDEASTTKMIMEWGTKEGRAKLRKLYGSHEDDEENGIRRSKRFVRSTELGDTGSDTESDEETLRMRKKRKKQKEAPTSIATDDSDLDGPTFESPATRARRSANGVRTRQQIASVAKKQKQVRAKSKSVPLPKVRDLLRRRLKSRRTLKAHGTGKSKKASRKAGREQSESHDDDESQPKLRRSKRTLAKRSSSSRTANSDCETETDDKHDKDFLTLDDTIKQLSDADDEAEDEEVVEMELEEIEESVGSDEDDEVEEVMSEGGDDDENEDDEDVDSEYLSEEKEEIRRPRSRRKTNGRRKRTRPRNIFQAQGDALSAREQQERLDFLVQQSATIAKDLHVAMAAQSGKHTDEMKNMNEHGQSDKTVVEKEEEVFVPPTGENCTLQPHQNEGIKWLLMLDAQGLNAILADEMGLGKTIQAISFLASLVISGSRGPHLVIAPRNVCAHWAEEVRKFYPGQIAVVTHLGAADERFENLERILMEDSFDIMVTSYELAARDLFSKKRREGFPSYSSLLRAFRNVEFEYLVVDEAHRLKNDNSKINIGIRNYVKAQRRLLLTGTPLSNNLKELWSLMNVLNPQIFSSKATFETWFSAPFSSKLDKKNAKVGLTAAEKSVIVDRLHTVIRPFFRRRVRADVCPTFTSADEVVIRCPMSSMQKALMLHLQQRATTKDAGLNNVVMAMRRVSNHPYIVSQALYDNYSSQVTTRIVAASGKFAFLYYALPRLLAGDHRVLIFSQFREVLDFLEDLMELLGIKFSRLDGMTSADARSSGLAEFNREGSDIPVFLLTTRAGGVGLNLQTADTVILFDSDWNPSADLQAVSRIQRIGQKKTVHILRLVTDNSVDDLIVEAARNKMKTQQVAVGAGKFNTSHGAALDQRMRQRDLEQLLQKLELINYNEIDCSGAVAGTGDNDTSSTQREERIDQQMYMKWDKALLRAGEAALPKVSIDPVWIDSVDGSRSSDIPKWLRSDADIWAAAKALCSRSPFAAIQEYEDALKSKALIGSYSKQGRAARARRQVINYDDFSDLESGDDEDDPELVINDADIVEDESDVEVTDNGSDEREKLKEPKPRSGLFQAWSKNQGNASAPSVAELSGSSAVVSQAPNTTSLIHAGVVAKGGSYESIPTVSKFKGLSTPNGGSNKPAKYAGPVSSQAQNLGVSTCPAFQPVSSRSAKSASKLTNARSVGLGIVPSVMGHSLPPTPRSQIPCVSAQQTNVVSKKIVPISQGNGAVGALIPPASQSRQKGRAQKASAAQDHTAQYVLEYRRLCAAMRIPPTPPDPRRPEPLIVGNTKKSASISSVPPAGLSGGAHGSAGLPIGLRKIAPASSTNQVLSLSSSQVNGQAPCAGLSGLNSNATSSQVLCGSRKGNEMPILLRKTVPPFELGSTYPLTANGASQSRAPNVTKGGSFNCTPARSPPTRPATRVVPQETIVAEQFTRRSMPTMYRQTKLPGAKQSVNRSETQAHRSERNVPLGLKARNGNVKRSFATTHQLSKRRTERLGKPERAVSKIQTNRNSKTRPQASRRPTVKPATEVVVISDSEDDFEISFSART